ncbi:TOPRIM nucleotidyl transferase/hydrolase domain-containing protein [Clostridium botulinum]|uniref:TOPRIM nucleotidyl transferase/hydrolase domain-containing protein n=1 Tax=Clostridium botulinum TaxID=1491 RepID=UPI0030D1C3CE
MVNCYGKANIPMFMKILNHFGVNYTAIHDIDAPYARRKEKKVKNAMWTINEKIFKESRIEDEIDNMIIANMPDFEFQYFKYLQNGDKPYNAICELRNAEFIKTDRYTELVNILESIISRKHKRSIKSISDYYILLCKYIEKEIPEPKELWALKEAEEAYVAYKEASATEDE